MLEQIKSAVEKIMGEGWEIHSNTSISQESENAIDVYLVLQSTRNPGLLYDSRYHIYTNHNIEHQVSMMVLNIYYKDVLSKETGDLTPTL